MPIEWITCGAEQDQTAAAQQSDYNVIHKEQQGLVTGEVTPFELVRVIGHLEIPHSDRAHE